MDSYGDDVFIKRPNEHGAALAEAAGLRWLKEGAPAAIVEVLDASETAIVTARVTEVRPTAEAAYEAGRQIAFMHRAGAAAHGAPPAPGGEEFRGQNFIGTQPQDCTPSEQWGSFYTQQRVLPFAETARQQGTLSEQDYRDVLAACQRIEASDYNPPVARIHGDLWAGNLLFSEEGPILIDPAAHGGAALTDIAMLALFGAPFFDQIVQGYQSISALEENWRELIPLHQMHPLAVHAATHGPSYGRELGAAARAVTSLGN
ncbi:fructosamine kinase family protein [Corynebacterium sp. TAE3-ERU30]|uniref:fructosamine kinase family protein n=1 Tax=Corynebacterium sp. TAE3-ERU30 TaxID=2849496 RepID=UPI001C49589B|nr:fructosamine kinase family protein [Corynebacterium sp. TAE3-ERU30]MBV7281314.1 fructosamine kinase family protein [Corynebacterium sp. TAE3-ERU30]